MGILTRKGAQRLIIMVGGKAFFPQRPLSARIVGSIADSQNGVALHATSMA
jgi:hypothetical protein